MPIVKICKTCGEQFKTKPFFVKNGGGIYCSIDCHHKGLKKGQMVKCFICNKEIYRSPKSLRISKSKKYFCSKSCQTKWRNVQFIGEKHGNWANGKYSYRSVLTRNKIPKICKLCDIKDDRILAVHHIDKNRLNNKLGNLTWLCHNCHFLVHHDDVSRKKLMETLV